MISMKLAIEIKTAAQYYIHLITVQYSLFKAIYLMLIHALLFKNRNSFRENVLKRVDFPI